MLWLISLILIGVISVAFVKENMVTIAFALAIEIIFIIGSCYSLYNLRETCKELLKKYKI